VAPLDDLAGLTPEHRAIVAAVTRPQHRRLLAYLCRNGRTSCSVLEAACDVRSVTSRMAELIGKGLPILATRDREPTAAGEWRRATFYEVTGPALQRDLFETT
jgi:hypothetical protein